MTELAALLWDMDGTLIDSERYWFKAEADLVHTGGGTWSREQADECVGKPLQFTAHQVKKAGGLREDVEDISRLLIESMAGYIRTDGVPYRIGAEELVTQARAAGLKLALVTLAVGPYVEAVWDGLQGFDVCISGDAVTRQKPDPEAYLAAMAQLGLEAHQCVALEDSPTGVKAAAASGATTIFVPQTDRAERPEGVCEFTSLGDVTLETIERLHAERHAS